jgi:hypothetical protein
MEMRAAAAIPPPPSLPEKPLTPATAEPSPSSAPINTHVAPPADQRERPDASLPAHKAPDRTAKDHPHMAALPPQTTFDAPALTIIRGNRRSGVARRARTAEKRKLAALPSHAPPARTATDARPIAILRGAPTRRYAFASSAVPPEPLVIIRGARPRPSLLQYYVQPNALILRVPH